MVPKIPPYMVTIKDPEKKQSFLRFLDRNGFTCASTGQYPVVFVNMEWKRYGVLYHPFSYSHVRNRCYALEAFLHEVFLPWEASQPDHERALLT